MALLLIKISGLLSKISLTTSVNLPFLLLFALMVLLLILLLKRLISSASFFHLIPPCSIQASLLLLLLLSGAWDPEIYERQEGQWPGWHSPSCSEGVCFRVSACPRSTTLCALILILFLIAGS